MLFGCDQVFHLQRGRAIKTAVLLRVLSFDGSFPFEGGRARILYREQSVHLVPVVLVSQLGKSGVQLVVLVIADRERLLRLMQGCSEVHLGSGTLRLEGLLSIQLDVVALSYDPCDLLDSLKTRQVKSLAKSLSARPVKNVKRLPVQRHP